MISICQELGLVVTRYADDITVSGPAAGPLLKFETELHRILEKSESLKLTLNQKKRGIYGPGERRMVTGLILTPDGKISIGRERKREISSLIHKYKNDCLSESEIMRAKGLLGFAYSAERDFFGKLFDKYGESTILSLQRFDADSILIDI